MRVVKLRVVTFRVDEELLERLDEAAARMGVSRSELIRRILARCVGILEEYAEPKVIRIQG